MNKTEENNQYKLLILDRIKDPALANAAMEVIANNKGDEALALVIDEMETVDVARLFTEAFDYTKPNQAAGLIKPDIAADCILAILARRSLSRLNENPAGAAQDINDFLTAVILCRPIKNQSKFKDLFEEYIDLFAACMMCAIGYHGEELINTIETGEQGTVAEIANNLGCTELLLESVKAALGKEHIESHSDSGNGIFDATFVERRAKFVESSLTRFHQKAIEKFGAEATSDMEEFMDM